MAPRLRLPTLLVVLTLAAALSPLAGAQSGSTSSGSIVLSTGAAAYPPGGAVLFALHNQGSWNTTLGEMKVIAEAKIVGTFTPGVGTIAPGASASFDWKAFVGGAPAPQGNYWGILRVTEQRVTCGYNNQCTTYPWAYDVYVNGRAQGSAEPGWLIREAVAAPPAATARLAVSVEPSAAFGGQSIKVTLTNTGTQELSSSPCDIGFSVRSKDTSAEVYNSVKPGQACIQMAQILAPGASLSLAWDQGTSAGPAAPGSYLVRGQYGATFSGDASLSIVGSATAPPPPRPAPASLTLTGPRDASPPGAALQFLLTNTGGATVEGTLGASAMDGQGKSVWHLVTAQVVQVLEPGKSLLFTWDQRLDSGAEAPAGKYWVLATFGGLHAGTSVELQGRAATGPPPPPAAPPPPPAEEKPVVGRIEAKVDAAGQPCYKGDWVTVCVDTAARAVYDFSAGGKLMVRRLALPGSGSIVVSAEPGAIVLRTNGAVITIYDSPAGSLRLEAPGASGEVQLQLGDGLAASVTKDGATLRGPGYEALLLVQGEGSVSTLSQATVNVGLRPDEGGEAGFVLRAMPAAAQASAPAAQVTLSDAALVKAALDAALPGAIAAQKVGAEAYISREGGELKTSVVPYIAADVNIGIASAQPGKLVLNLDVSRPEGRTLVFHLGPDVLVGASGGFRVTYDGQPIAMASGLADVLDPDDDGLAAEYVLVQGSAGVDLAVSVPHFSPHTLGVESLSQIVPSLAPYGAAAGFAVMLAAAVYMFRRSQS